MTSKEFKALSDEEIISIARKLKSYDELEVDDLKFEAQKNIWHAIDALKAGIQKYKCDNDSRWAEEMEEVAEVIKKLHKIVCRIEDKTFIYHRENDDAPSENPNFISRFLGALMQAGESK